MAAWTENYYSQARQEMVKFVPSDTRRLLDIGCGEGRFGAAVKAAIPDCETWGVEPASEAAQAASGRNDRIINSEISPLLDLPLSYFDVVTMNDVLEHIPYSEPTLDLVKRVLRPGGLSVLSLPNIRYYLNARDFLVHKDWEYQDFGVLDRTHLRFFTEKSARRLLEREGYEILSMSGINGRPLKFHYRALFSLAPDFFRDMQHPQFAVVARPLA